jgi:hypothetical protein
MGRTQEGHGCRKRERRSVPVVFGDVAVALHLVANNARQHLMMVLFGAVVDAIDCMPTGEFSQERTTQGQLHAYR